MRISFNAKSLNREAGCVAVFNFKIFKIMNNNLIAQRKDFVLSNYYCLLTGGWLMGDPVARLW